jgi:outer membrane lipoprotein carrier protein
MPLMLLVLHAGATQAPAASDPPPAEILRTIQRAYRDSPGLVARFSQVVTSRSLPAPQREEGTLYLKPPGKMRWEYSRPRGKLAITDGVKATLYLPEDRAVLMGPVKDLEGSALTARLLGGSASLEEEFRAEAQRSSGDARVWVLSLSPRTGDFPYDSVTVEASQDGWIQSIRLLDPLGNQIEYRFERIRSDKNLPEKLFRFDVPRGVEIQSFGGKADAPASP